MTVAAPLYYAVKLVKNGPRVPCKIWHGQPPDPITGELLDRSPRWQVEMSGEPVDPWRVIIELDGTSGQPVVKGEIIDQAEHDYLLGVHRWAMEHNPDAPEASPREAIDLNRIPPIF